MKTTSKVWQFSVAVATLLLGACATAPHMSFEKFKDGDAEVRAAFKEDTAAEIQAKQEFDDIMDARLSAGLPVHFEEGGVKLTKIWDKQANKLNFYDGHITGAMGSESLLVMSVMTTVKNDRKGSVTKTPEPQISINRVTGKPEYTVFAGNVSVQETMARALTKVMMTWPGYALNGAVAAEISKCNDCGATWNVMGGAANALNQNKSEAGANVDFSSAP